MQHLFKPGERVICIDDSWEPLGRLTINPPKKGEQFTVEKFKEEFEGVVYIFLKEYANHSFNQLRFKKV